MSKSQVLALRFQCANGKKYNVRIKNADPAVNADTVKKLADTMVSTKAFDFDGKKSPYSLNSATYTTTNKQAVIAAK